MRRAGPPILPDNINADKQKGRFSILEWDTLLQWRENPAIIDVKNKNAAACGCANTRKPAQVRYHLHNGPKGRTAWDIIRHSGPPRKGRVLPLSFLSCAAVCMGALLLALCGDSLHSVFVFHPAPGGALPPGTAAVNNQKEEIP